MASVSDTLVRRDVYQSAVEDLKHFVRDVFGHRVTLQSLGAAFAAVTAFLDATERRFGKGRDKMIDREIADLDVAGEISRIDELRIQYNAHRHGDAQQCHRNRDVQDGAVG